nr:unnamed protein product [Hydra vulgaris]
MEDIDRNYDKFLVKRTNLKEEQITSICTHHRDMLIVRYESRYQKSCCCPFLTYKKVYRASLHVITMHTVLEAETVSLNLIPRKKLCPTCQRKVINHLSKSMSENKYNEGLDIVSETSVKNKKDGVNRHFRATGVSPIKIKG